jgi:uncharacterized hydrophobic protein (TIGR00271 family)
MLRVRLTARADRAADVERALVGTAGLHRVASSPAASGEGAVLEADLRLDVADELVDTLGRLGVPPEDFVLSQLDVVAPTSAVQGRLGAGDAFAWVEVLGEARQHARPLARYLLLMAVAGVIAGLGVIKGNAILVVGAMAASPDLLPLCAACVGLVGGRARLARRALATLLIGLTLVGAAAALLTLALEVTDIISADLVLGSGGLNSLAETDYSTVLVALAAGVAAMLAFETRAREAVGVAISVTTIPASAYWGVALGSGEADGAGGALLVLAVNVCLLLLSGSATLAVQRRWSDRRAHRVNP